jgi:hypothetical protein
MTNDKVVTTDGQLDTRSPEDIIRERMKREEVERRHSIEQAARDEEARLDKQYQDLRMEILGLLQTLPDRLRSNGYRGGRIEEVLNTLNIHHKRRFLRKPISYFSIETRQQALWYAGYADNRVHITSDAIFMQYVLADTSGYYMSAEKGDQLYAYLPISTDEVLPEARPAKSLHGYVQMLDELKQAIAAPPEDN